MSDKKATKAATEKKKQEPSSSQCDQPTPRELFTSRDWDYTNIRPQKDSCAVEMRNIETGALAQLSVQSGSGPGYKASMQYEHLLSGSLADVIRQWFEGVRKMHEDHGFPVPPPLPCDSSPIPLTISMEVDSSPDSGHFSANGRIKLADSIDAELAIGGLHESIEVTARGSSLPLFLYGNAEQAPAKVGMINIHRMGRTGGTEAIATVFDCNKRIHSEGIVLPNNGNIGEVVIPLIFPGGTLSTPIGEGGNQALNDVGRYLSSQLEVAVLAGTGAILLSTNGKYKCLRSILTMFGACTLCTIGMLAAAATGPAILIAASLCFGGKAMAIINLILGHMGFDP